MTIWPTPSLHMTALWRFEQTSFWSVIWYLNFPLD